MAVGALRQALAFDQVPAVMSRVRAEAGHMVLGVSLLIPPFTLTWAFLYLQEKVIALDVTGQAWPLTYHHAALWNEASAVSGLLGEGEERERREGVDAWAINMEQFNCQALQFTSDPRSMGNAMGKSFSTPLSVVLQNWICHKFHALLSSWCFCKEDVENRTPYNFDSSLERIQARSVYTDVSLPFNLPFSFWGLCPSGPHTFSEADCVWYSFVLLTARVNEGDKIEKTRGCLDQNVKFHWK